MAGSANKVLLIGWGTADWQLIHPLLDAGELPSLNKLINNGIMGALTPISPVQSEALWTSAVTGTRADRHLILSASEPDHSTGGLRQTSSQSRQGKAIWNILSEQGLDTHVINWAASHPAEAVNGVFVSERFHAMVGLVDESWPIPPHAIHPSTLEAILAQHRLHPGELSGEELLPLVPKAAQIDQQHDRHLAFIAEQMAGCSSVHAIATWILEYQPWDFLAVRYDALEKISRQFLRYLPPHRAGISEQSFEMYQDVIPSFYRFYDMMLGRLLELAGTDASIMLISEQGVPRNKTASGIRHNRHRPHGILAMTGPGIKHDEYLYGANLLDITPTLLTLYGLPPGEDMEGRPLYNAFSDPIRIARIPSWEGADETCPARPSDAQEVPDTLQDALDALGDAGYVDQSGAAELRGLYTVKQLQHYNLARSYIDAGHPDKAVSLLETLLKERPQARVCALTLAQCYYQMGQHEECRRLVRNVLDCELDGPVTDLMEANLCLIDDRTQEALTYLQRAQYADPGIPEVHCQIGRAYIKMDRLGDASHAFKTALSIDRDYMRAYFGLALTSLKLKHYEQAASHALDCIALEYHFPPAHHVLGESLARLGKTAQAIQAFELSLQMQPDSALAHHWLAAIYQQALGDDAQAAQHRHQADELSRRKRTSRHQNNEGEVSA